MEVQFFIAQQEIFALLKLLRVHSVCKSAPLHPLGSEYHYPETLTAIQEKIIILAPMLIRENTNRLLEKA